MPKTPKGKKRKGATRTDRRRKKPKRLKFEEEAEEAKNDVKPETVEPEGEEVEENKEDGEQNLEQMLEKHADKNNLSAINVKSILHHVITDKRVLDLMQKVITEKEKLERSEESGETDEINLEFEPKMTRSKYRQKNLEDPIAQLTKSPLKCHKQVSTFTDLEFPESSSDEEYDPDEDEEDEDTESYLSHQSDLASPFTPATPDTGPTDTPQDTNSVDIPSPSVSRPLTRHRSQEMIFKKPELVSTATPDKNDLIAKRTRSLLPLKDKELLEFTLDFELPDFSPDLYDQIQLDDLDEDQLAFQIFLQSLANYEDVDDIMADLDDDIEYDFMAEDHIEEKEEYRNDRAVRIPKQEVSDLFDELLSQCNEYEDDDTLWNARSLLLDIEESDKDAVLFTDQQRFQLSKQMSQHMQLLCQVYLLSREEPTLQVEADMCRQYVNELQGFCDRSLSVHPILALGGKMPTQSMFDIPGIMQADRIVNDPFSAVKRPRSPRKQATTAKDCKSKTVRSSLPVISSINQAIMAKSPVFREPILLPRHGFMDKDFIEKKETASLRVKFIETEDNLLALGMKQFHRNWKLIQSHLLPVKTPKQLQIRCKNLHSSRSQDNILKHLRDTKTLWKLPDEIKVCAESDCYGRKLQPTLEPEWLISFHQKVKPHKKALPLIPSQRTLPMNDVLLHMTPASHSGLSTMIGTTPFSQESVSTQVLLSFRKQKLSSSETEKPMNIISPVAPGFGNQEKSAEKNYVNNEIQTTKILEETVDLKTTNEVEKDQRSCSPLVINSPGESSVVTENRNSVNAEEQRSTASPDILHSKNTDHGDDNQPGNDDDGCYDDMDNEPPIETDDNVPCAQLHEDKHDMIQGSSESYSPGPSDVVEKASKSPSSVTTKSKRDKPSNVTSLSGSSNAKKNNPSLVMTLPSDPKEHIRSQALADSYMVKVKKALKNNQDLYEEFLGTLVESTACQWTPVQLYKRMEIVLAEYPELIEDFVAFLEPEQALEAGVLMENLEFIRARAFLRRLEVHFHKHRSYFQKIIEAFSTWNAGDKTPLELHEKVIPLLRGQQHLVDEFQSFFDNLKPPVCSDEDFEEVEIGSGSDPEVDDFEEVVIPDIIEPRKPKGKLKVRHAARTTPSTKQKLTSKPMGVVRTKNTKNDKRRNMPKKSPQGMDCVSRDDVASGISDGEEEINNKKDETNNSMHHKRLQESRTDCDDLFSEQNPSSVRTEGSTSDGPLSVASSFHNDTSNDSVKQDDHEEPLKPKWMGGVSHDVMDDVSVDITENDDNDESDNYDDNDESAYDTCEDTQDGSEFTQRTLSAQNHQLNQDGQLVVLWTRDDDRIILSTCRHEGAMPETYDELSTKLEGKTANEIKRRFEELMKLIEVDHANQDSSSEEEDEDEESEGSEPETDS